MPEKDKDKKAKARLEALELIAVLAKPVGCANQGCRSCETCQARAAQLVLAFKMLEGL